jgi:adenylate cyclase
VKERAAVLTHDAAMDFAASKGKSMILNRISSAIVAPLLHNNDVLGVMWLDSETLAQFQPRTSSSSLAIANQAAMFIEINILGKKIEAEIVTRERFSRLLSPNIAERVISGELEVKQGRPARRRVHRVQQRHPRLHAHERGHASPSCSSRCSTSTSS